MKPIRFALGAIAIAVAGNVVAAVTPSTYSFTNATKQSGTGGSASDGAVTNNSAGWGNGTTTGANWGNSLTFTSTGTVTPVTVTAWASTGGSGGFGGTIQSAALTRYGTNELAITSRSALDANGSSTGTSGTTDSMFSGSTTTANASINAELLNYTPNSSDLQHAMDNAGGYEALMFSFTSAVTLKDVSVGFPSSSSGIDSDMTFLVYTGKNCKNGTTVVACSATPTSGFSTRTFADLIANGGWELAGNGIDVAQAANGTVSLTSSASSQYWMAGAYMAIGSNTTTSPGTTKPADYVKVSGLTAIRAVPEPSSIALFGIAAVGLLATRRRKARPA